MATVHGAHACYLADQVGSLETGKRADLVLLTRDSYHLAADNNLPVQLVYCENGASVETVFVDGEVVVENGRLTTIDETALYREVGRARDALRGTFEGEVARAAALDPPLRAMYLRLADEPIEGLCPSARYE
jgi:5-methylthioadenosine/S-adenosylhomocysteine deaminase